jgi:hypothetical protein
LITACLIAESNITVIFFISKMSVPPAPVELQIATQCTRLQLTAQLDYAFTVLLELLPADSHPLQNAIIQEHYTTVMDLANLHSMDIDDLCYNAGAAPALNLLQPVPRTVLDKCCFSSSA